MTFGRLLLRNLFFHWRGNSAVLLGVVVGAAVLTGALLVGDSLRGSLHDLALRQLGWVEYALVGGRFVREDLANELHAERIAPAILLQGSASVEPAEAELAPVRRVGRVAVLGVDDRFWPDGQAPLCHDFWRPADPEDVQKSGVVLNATLANELGVKEGDKVSLWLQKASEVPRESLLGRRKASDVLDRLTLTVRAVLPDDAPSARFTLTPTPEAPRNAFVPLGVLQAKLEQKGQVNALLAAGPASPLQEQLAEPERLKLDDWGLFLTTPEGRAMAAFRRLDPRNRRDWLPRFRWQGRVPDELAKQAGADGRLTRAQFVDFYKKHHPYLSLESRQMLIDRPAEKAALEASRDARLRAAPTLIYLADAISDGKRTVPYSVVAALDPTKASPLGPFLPPGADRLRDDEILLADWKESPLRAKPGDKIILDYYQLDQHGHLDMKTAEFTVRGFVPLQGVADDPDLTPEFRGITDELDIRNWSDPPFPYDPKRVGKPDEDYWKRYRTAPKAYITLTAGQRLWSSRFGDLTSIRLAPKEGGGLAGAAGRFEERLLSHLSPEQGGLVFDPVRERAMQASAGGTDFGGLFLGFSFFLIVAALLLVGLLFGLNLDRRASEVGVLFASGYRRLTVQLLLLAEGGLIAAAGAAVGCVVAVLYASGLLELLRAWWPGGLDRSFLRLHAGPMSFVYGFGGAFLMGLLAVAWSVWAMGRVPPRALLAGQTTSENEPGSVARPPRWSIGVALGCVLLAVALAGLGPFVPRGEMRAMTFFGSGALLLIAGLAAVWAWMRRTRHGRIGGHGLAALGRLSARNAARHPVRSLLTAGLLASAAFLLVAVESFRREAGRDFLDKNSGSGGFTLLAESDIPVFQDLNAERGREEVIGQMELALARPDADPANSREQVEAARAELRQVRFYPFRVRPGDDASCLNLYQTRRPRLLGVPPSLIERGGFHFAGTLAKTPEEKANPWRLLDRADDAIPVFGEKNTVEWMLKNKLDGELEVPNGRGEPVRLRIVGLLQDSVFQSGLLMSEANFLKLYPGEQGYRFFLIDTKEQPPGKVKDVLQTALADHGLEATSTADRLDSYLAVENTYLSTFQALGGLGLLLGALGLAVVLLRGVWERRGELALLRALGFPHRALGWLVLAENGLLLLLGLGAGVTAALVAVTPHLAVEAGQVPWLRLAVLLALVLAVGVLAGGLAVRASLRALLIPALRQE